MSENQHLSPAENYKATQAKLKSGWGTFNDKSVLSHLFLPEGIALNLGVKLKQITPETYLKDAYISSRDPRLETIIPGYKAYDGSYSELTIEWSGVKFKVESATTETNDLLLLVTPVSVPKFTPNLVLETGMLWNKPGVIELQQDSICIKTKTKELMVRSTNPLVDEFLANTSPYMAVVFDQQSAFYTGEEKSLSEIQQIVAHRRAALEAVYAKYGQNSDVYQAIHSVIGWNVIYDAAKDRIVYPVSRLWNQTFGGVALFDWDTYFGAWMASLESKELAYANAVEITKSITPGGFIPNYAGGSGLASYDRSQPPVGSLVFTKLYEKFQEKWLLEYVFDDLLTWNRWWPANRDNIGLLCWGSNPTDASLKEDGASNNWQGAAYESGLDNSPMFDDVPFNTDTHQLEIADVGLTALYVMDCDKLAEIAIILDKQAEADELKARADLYRKNLAQLWDNEYGFYLNKRTDTGELSKRISPTNFYPMLAKAPTQAQAERMVSEHLMNPEEFFGEWMVPSSPKNDPAFGEQEYWRGRIWGPLNFLVYLGLCEYDLPEARTMLAEKSKYLMMENVKINGYIYENYNSITGNVHDLAEGRSMGDNYYHWGALLGFIDILENCEY